MIKDMISLKMDDSSEIFLRIKKSDDNLWQIEVGPWYENGKPWMETQNFLTKEKILMSRNDLKSFVEETKRILDNKITKETRLNLSFKENEPQLRIDMCLVDQSYPLFSGDLVGKVSFTPSINVKYLTRAYGREEDQYLYENGGKHSGLIQYYMIEEIADFVKNIEKEIAQS